MLGLIFRPAYATRQKSPLQDLMATFKNTRRNKPIFHGAHFTVPCIPKWPASCSFVFLLNFCIHFKVNFARDNNSKNQTIAIQPIATKHEARCYTFNTTQKILSNIFSKFFTVHNSSFKNHYSHLMKQKRPQEYKPLRPFETDFFLKNLYSASLGSFLAHSGF